MIVASAGGWSIDGQSPTPFSIRGPGWRLKGLLVAAAIGLVCQPVASAAEPAQHRTLSEICSSRTEGFTDDVKCYFTAPARWDGRDWTYFGSAVAATALAHQFDDDVRNHFVGSSGAPPNTKSYSQEDALPAIGVFAGTLLYATFAKSEDAKSESWQMFEAAGFSSVTTYVLKYAAGRERPNATSDPNDWRAGGESFPSGHTTVAFAIGTVFAESGDPRYRWARRFVGYGMAGYTAYARMEHSAHWLSDTVAGAAIGASTAEFVMNRHKGPATGQLTWTPLDHGAMLSYNVLLP